VNFGAQEFGEGIFRLQGVLENANMLCHDMQPNAFLIWQKKLLLHKVGVRKMPGPKGVITLKSDQRDALVYKNVALTHAGRFGEKEAQELVAKVAKTHGGSTPVRTAAHKPPIGSTLWLPAEKKSTFMHSMSNQPATDQATDDKKKGVTDKEVAVDPVDTDRKLHISAELDAK
jgi:hypothetical protein